MDIKTALEELFADRHLFQLMPYVELEGITIGRVQTRCLGTFGELRWAIWRQTQRGLCGDIDDDEDGAVEEVAVMCKTLKPSADRIHFQKFLAEALVFHNVPSHSNLAQVSGHSKKVVIEKSLGDCRCHIRTFSQSRERHRLSFNLLQASGLRKPQEILAKNALIRCGGLSIVFISIFRYEL